MELVGRFLQIPDRSCFLLGPRGTGKSTWLRHRLGVEHRAMLLLFMAASFGHGAV